MARSDKEAHDIVDSENRLKHQQDLARLIDAHGQVVHKTMTPFKERRIANHFFEEYDKLWKGNKR